MHAFVIYELCILYIFEYIEKMYIECFLFARHIYHLHISYKHAQFTLILKLF